MRFLLRLQFFVDALELFLNPCDLLASGIGLLSIQFHGHCAGQSPLRAVYDRGHDLQIADQLGAGRWRSFLLRLPLRFKKQPGVLQNALADRCRTSAPSPVQLPGFPHSAVLLGEDRRHALAVLQALARHGHEKLHRYLRRDFALAHLLLDGLRQKLRQRQPPRYPTHAAIEPARQLLQSVAEALLHLLKQPAHFQCALLFG
jgi:hypothetical protein